MQIGHLRHFETGSIMTTILFLCLNKLKRLPMEVVQYHGNLRDQVSKLSLGPSLSKISLIFWTCCAGRIRY